MSDEGNPLTVLMESGMREALIRAIERLPEREKLVLSLCYDQELNLREIGAVLEVTESRVCQIRSQAITRLRSQLRGLL
jgi:RNA polymerase sigma factor for flagellar operon FliA